MQASKFNIDTREKSIIKAKDPSLKIGTGQHYHQNFNMIRKPKLMQSEVKFAPVHSSHTVYDVLDQKSDKE